MDGWTGDQFWNIRWARYVSILLLIHSTLFLGQALARDLPVAPVTINWSITHQTIDGFGASATGYTGTFTPALADRFFSPTSGLGLSLLRIRVIAGTEDADCGCVANGTPYRCEIGSKSQIVSGDLQVAELAAARGVRLFAAPWSPPASMKSSHRYCGSGAFIGNAANYAAYAAALSSFPSLLNAHGLSIDAISVQNEPDIANGHYDTCTWTGRQIHDFVPYLASALTAAGYGGIKIAVPEQSNWDFGLMSTSMEDPKVAAQVGLVLGHAYGPRTPSAIPSTSGRRVWQTEVSGLAGYDGSMNDAMTWARSIHNFLEIGANAWMYWNLDCGKDFFHHHNDMCLTDANGNFAQRAYVLGQFAKFIRPGWQRLDVTNAGRLLVTAYKGPENSFAIVAINNSRREARSQTFRLNHATSQRSQVTPWLTSASASLEPQPAVSLTSNGTTFTYTVPAHSVVTFQGQAD